MNDIIVNDIFNIFMAKVKDEVYKETTENIKTLYQRLMEIETEFRIE